jgi:hypothetical protein
MKKLHPLMFLVAIVLLTSCGPVSKLTKAQAYRGIYEEKPLSVLIMPPINRSTNVDAKEYFHTTLNVPIIDAGYYVVPPFLSMEILKRESAYDSELFIERPSLLAFKEIFGADVALFTIIHKWDKSSIGSTVTIEVEYIIRSTDSGEVLYTRRGTIVYNASVNTGGGIIANMVASAISTALTKYVDVARGCNNYTFSDLPRGKYSSKYQLDAQEMSGLKKFKVRLSN